MSLTSPSYTAAQLEAGIANAIKAHDMQAAVDILKVLCGVDMKRALAVHETILAGLIVARVLNDDRPCVMQPADDCSTALPCASCPETP